jgi:2-methylcitrate dehydratase PrpD
MMFADTIAWAWDNPPARARHLLLDSLGCALAGLRHAPLAGFARALASAMPGGIRLRPDLPGLAPAAAAAILSAAMCWDEANDGLPQAHGRPGLASAPIALVALDRGVEAALAAYALGGVDTYRSHRIVAASVTTAR